MAPYALGRLSEVTLGVGATLETGPVPLRDDWTQRYAYDAYGNRTLSKAFGPLKFVVCTGPTSQPNCEFSHPELPSDRRDGLDGITYHPYTNRITTAGYGYDAEGNLVRAQRADGTWQRYKYDAAGRLADITDDIGNLQERYIYGEGRRRLGKENRDRFVQARTYYAWSGDQVLGEYVELSAFQRPIGIIFSKSYVYLGERLLAKLVLNSSGGRELTFHHPGYLC
jgi:YD repeat-containing protein